MASNYYFNEDDIACTSCSTQPISAIESSQPRTIASFENRLDQNLTELGESHREELPSGKSNQPRSSQSLFTDCLLHTQDSFTDSFVDSVFSQGKREATYAPGASFTSVPEHPTSTLTEMKSLVEGIVSTSSFQHYNSNLLSSAIEMPESIPAVVDTATSIAYNIAQIPQMVNEYQGSSTRNHQSADTTTNHFLLEQINSILEYNEPVSSSIGDDACAISPVSDSASNFSYEDSLSPGVAQLPSPSSGPSFKSPPSGCKTSRKFTKQNSEEYRKIREKNNIAVKKSREKAKQRQKLAEEKVKKLLEENAELRDQVNNLTKELNTLKQLFASVIHTRPDVIEEMKHLSQS